MRFKRAESRSQSFNADLHSNLASLLFERIQVDQQLVVLDIGPAMPTTVDLFANFKCKLIFIDLYSLDLLSGNCPDDYEPTHQQLVEQFTAALNLEANTKINICLFWDFFNYLDGTLLKAFIDSLHPYIDDSTCGYGLGVLNARSQLPNYQYGIKNLDKLHQYLGTEEQKPVYPHSQRDLNNLLGYFDIDKSRLMPDGRVEYFLSQGSDDKFVKKPVF
mgnify:CR=1 FL=1